MNAFSINLLRGANAAAVPNGTPVPNGTAAAATTNEGTNASSDKIKIRPTMHLFHLSFTTGPYTHFMYITRDEAMRYVMDLMYLLPLDREPYQQIQFNFPCFPTLIYNISDMTNLTINVSIQERLRSLFDNWPEARQQQGRFI